LSKRNRNRKLDSVREKKEIEELYRQAYENAKSMMQYISDRMKNKENVDAEMVRFVKNSGKIIEGLKFQLEHLKDVEKDTGLAPGKMKEFIDKFSVQADIFKDAYEIPFTQDAYTKVYSDYDLIRCKLCNELHPKGMECPWFLLAKECDIVVNENMTEIISKSKPDKENSELDSDS